jgi:hypothetical protein
MVMLGMMLETYDGKSIPGEAWFMFALSPVILPILIGEILMEKSNRDE